MKSPDLVERTSDPPLISVVMSTYNRSNILPYSIGSLINSTWKDWELIVVGDACTDDTAAVITALNEPRIRFVNLPENHGEQSKPNNEGMKMARGTYISILNHDDFYFPDHLSTAAELFEMDSTIDFVLAGNIRDRGVIQNADGQQHPLIEMNRQGRKGTYRPYISAWASSMTFHRRVIDKIGFWKSAFECYMSPSQEFLYRAHRANLKMVWSEKLTVYSLATGRRKNVYADRAFAEHADIFERLTHDTEGLRAEMANHLLMKLSKRMDRLENTFSLRRTLQTIWRHYLLHPLSHRGLNLKEFFAFIRFKKKGKFINNLRERRGLPKKAVDHT